MRATTDATLGSGLVTAGFDRDALEETSLRRTADESNALRRFTIHPLWDRRMISLRMWGGRRTPGLACLVALISVAAAVAQEVPGKPSESRLEPWADPALKVTKGLVLWLDADRLGAARRAHGQPELSDGTRVEDVVRRLRATDGDLSQSREEARPTNICNVPCGSTAKRPTWNAPVWRNG